MVAETRWLVVASPAYWARHGVPSTVLESELQVSLGSRAIVFTRRSMEILQQVGVADVAVDENMPRVE